MLTPPQQQIIDAGLLTTGFNCVLQMPTGSGKTWLAELAMKETMSHGYRCIYLTPLRALADELTEKWRESMAPHCVGVFTGDYGKDNKPYPVPFNKAELLVMTPERLDACTRNWRAHWNWIPQIDLVVVDEFHLLGDGHRGARLEGTLSRMRRLNPFARLLCMSATLGNRYELADWLNGIEFSSDLRPIPLIWKTVKFRKASDKPDLLENEVNCCIRAGGKSLVFVQSRRRAEELAKKLKSCGLRAQHHHAGLSHPERKRVEEQFRSRELDVLIATATLEMGLNLPVRQVILYDLQRFNGSDFEPLPVTSVWQRAGRAGRRGLDESGEVILFQPSWERIPKGYERGEFEPVLSGLASPAHLADQIVTEISCGMTRTQHQLKQVFERSLAFRQRKLPNVNAILLEMIKAGMLSETFAEEGSREYLKATKLGRAACRHLLAPATIIFFKSIYERSIELSLFDLLLVAASVFDCEPVLAVNFEELTSLADILAHERSYLLRNGLGEMSEVLALQGKRLLSSIKMALTLRAWTRTGDIDITAELLSCYPFEVKALIETTERLLLAMKEVFKHDDKETGEDWHESARIEDKIKALSVMVSAGLDESTATLTLIQGIGPKLAKKLSRINIYDIEGLANASEDDLNDLQGVSCKRQLIWIKQAEELVKSRSANFFHEDGPRISSSGLGWNSRVDPYRFRRSFDLLVTPVNAQKFEVTGGLDPHIVLLHDDVLTCDCPDAAKGNFCKHQMAVQLFRRDSEFVRLKAQLDTKHDKHGVNLADLWFSHQHDRRVAA